ncbi:MAG TPA: histidine kinase [Melioribacteraceae bacterium]|nr:histidine kinase [Melioribacteraceae bacterium]
MNDKTKLILNKLHSFYIINIFGWLLFIIADTVITMLWMKINYTFVAYLINALQWSTGFIVTLLIRYFYKRIYKSSKSILFVLISVILLSICGALLLFVFSHLVYYCFAKITFTELINKSFVSTNIVFRMTQLFPIMLAWSMLYFGIKLWFDFIQEKERTQKAEYLAQTARLQLLRYQINPHFLFNSFSSLRALIRSNQELAIDMVGKIAEFYRYSLLMKNNITVPLISEIEAIKNYTEIEKIRFAENIEFIYDIDKKAESFLIPPFLIHPLIDNAIKYGMKTSDLPLRIYLSVKLINNDLFIEVKNSGFLVKSETELADSTKTGLQNIKERLKLVYPNRSKFSIFESEKHVTIKITIFENIINDTVKSHNSR